MIRTCAVFSSQNERGFSKTARIGSHFSLEPPASSRQLPSIARPRRFAPRRLPPSRSEALRPTGFSHRRRDAKSLICCLELDCGATSTAAPQESVTLAPGDLNQAEKSANFGHFWPRSEALAYRSVPFSSRCFIRLYVITMRSVRFKKPVGPRLGPSDHAGSKISLQHLPDHGRRSAGSSVPLNRRTRAATEPMDPDHDSAGTRAPSAVLRISCPSRAYVGRPGPDAWYLGPRILLKTALRCIGLQSWAAKRLRPLQPFTCSPLERAPASRD